MGTSPLSTPSIKKKTNNNPQAFRLTPPNARARDAREEASQDTQ